MSNSITSEPKEKETDSCSRVKFNVGGRHYEVPRSLIETFPSTMLARMTSETWQKDPEATLFIDRNGERFQYCLDYMRDGAVWLPLNVPKEGILLDLDYFGFEEVDTTKIHGGRSNLAAGQHLIKCKEEHERVFLTCMENVQAAEQHLVKCRKGHKKKEATLKAAFNSVDATLRCEEVAFLCFEHFSQGKSIDQVQLLQLCPMTFNLVCSNHTKFRAYLAKYGLALVCIQLPLCFTLKEKDEDASSIGVL